MVWYHTKRRKNRSIRNPRRKCFGRPAVSLGMGKLLDLAAARNKRSPPRVHPAMLIVDLIDAADSALRGEEEAFGDPELVEQYAQRRREALRMAREIAVEIADDH